MYENDRAFMYLDSIKGQVERAKANKPDQFDRQDELKIENTLIQE